MIGYGHGTVNTFMSSALFFFNAIPPCSTVVIVVLFNSKSRGQSQDLRTSGLDCA